MNNNVFLIMIMIVTTVIIMIVTTVIIMIVTTVMIMIVTTVMISKDRHELAALWLECKELSILKMTETRRPW